LRNSKAVFNNPINVYYRASGGITPENATAECGWSI
jgi:hypothetical protein